MNSFRLISIFVAVSTWLTACGKREAAPATDEPNSAAAETHVHRGANGETFLQFDAATQKTIGLEVATLMAVKHEPEIKCFGRVIDPAPLAELLIQYRKAQLAFDNSHAELERMKTLRKDNNASERAFQSAEAMYLQAQADVGAIMFSIERQFGRNVLELLGPMVVPPGTNRKPNQLLGEIGEARNAFLVRVDVPVSDGLALAAASARISGLSDPALVSPARYFGNVPAVDAQTQTQGTFFLVYTNQARLIPGMAVTAFIAIDGEAHSGVVVPNAAVIRYNGAAWIYRQTGAEEFVRRNIDTNVPLDNGWFVPNGLAAGDKVVVVGAQLILSEEMSEAGFSDGEHH